MIVNLVRPEMQNTRTSLCYELLEPVSMLSLMFLRWSSRAAPADGVARVRLARTF
jgi:hypothetical protein